MQSVEARVLRRAADGLWDVLYPLIAAAVWDRKAVRIHQRWGTSSDDQPALAEVLDYSKAASVLDLGCGSGRLFPLYAQRGLAVVGVDISETALRIARRRFPTVPIVRASLSNLATAGIPHCDLAVSNRVLQHVPARWIASVVAQIVALADWVYLNELSASDDRPPSALMQVHDYLGLFRQHKWRVHRSGRIGKQTWILFGR